MELSVVTENICLVTVLPFLVWEVAYEVLTSCTVMIHETLEQNVSFHLYLSSYYQLPGLWAFMTDSVIAQKLILHTMWRRTTARCQKMLHLLLATRVSEMFPLL